MTPLAVAYARARYARWTPENRPEPKPEPAPMPAGEIQTYDSMEAVLVSAKGGFFPTSSCGPSIKMILWLTAAHFRVSVLDIKSARRTTNVVGPRQIAMYLAKKMTLKSLPEIGRRMGGRDHTTVLYGVRKIEARIEIDGDLAADVAEIKRAIETRLGQHEVQP